MKPKSSKSIFFSWPFSKLHQLLSAATPGFHRLGAAAFALGAAVATLLLVLLDALAEDG